MKTLTLEEINLANVAIEALKNELHKEHKTYWMLYDFEEKSFLYDFRGGYMHVEPNNVTSELIKDSEHNDCLVDFTNLLFDTLDGMKEHKNEYEEEDPDEPWCVYDQKDFISMLKQMNRGYDPDTNSTHRISDETLAQLKHCVFVQVIDSIVLNHMDVIPEDL
jgi:hypothetical protein